ncbi:MAG: phosphotransferase [Pseudonocardiaceae bacterium]
MALLADLRRNRTAGAAHLTQTLDAWGQWPLTGGRNNQVYSWVGPDGPICIKVYQVDERRRAQREWRALTLLAHHGADYAPAPLWIHDAAEQPIIGMTLLPGGPLLDAEDMPVALTAPAETTRAVQNIPCTGRWPGGTPVRSRSSQRHPAFNLPTFPEHEQLPPGVYRTCGNGRGQPRSGDGDNAHQSMNDIAGDYVGGGCDGGWTRRPESRTASAVAELCCRGPQMT